MISGNTKGKNHVFRFLEELVIEIFDFTFWGFQFIRNFAADLGEILFQTYWYIRVCDLLCNLENVRSF